MEAHESSPLPTSSPSEIRKGLVGRVEGWKSTPEAPEGIAHDLAARISARNAYSEAQNNLAQLGDEVLKRFHKQGGLVDAALGDRTRGEKGGVRTDTIARSVTELLTVVELDMLPADFLATADPEVRNYAIRALNELSAHYESLGNTSAAPETWVILQTLISGDVGLNKIKDAFDTFKYAHAPRTPKVVEQVASSLSVAANGIDPAKRNLFTDRDDTVENLLRDELDPTVYMRDDGRGRMSVVKELTKHQKNRFEELTRKFTEKLEHEDHFAGRDDVPGADTIGYDEWNDLMQFVRFGTEGTFFSRGDRQEIVLRKLGISEDELSELRTLGKVYYENIAGFDTQTVRMSIQDAGLVDSLTRVHHELSVDNFMREFVGADGRISEDSRAKFKDMIEEYVFTAAKNVDPQRTWEEAFGHQEQAYVRYVYGFINGLAGNRELADSLGGTTAENYREVRQFLESQLGYVNTLINMYQTFHNLPQSAHDGAIFEKWPQFVGRIMTSEFAEVIRGDLVQIAIDAHAHHVHSRIIANNNIVPSDLFAGQLDQSLGERRNADFDAVQQMILDRTMAMGEVNPKLKGVTEAQARRAMIIAHGLSFVDLRFFEHLSMANPAEGHFKGQPFNALLAHMDYRKGWGGYRGDPENTKDVPILYKIPYQRFVPYELGKFGSKHWKPGDFFEDPEGYVLEEMKQHNDSFVDYVISAYESDVAYCVDGLSRFPNSWRLDEMDKQYVKPWMNQIKSICGEDDAGIVAHPEKILNFLDIGKSAQDTYEVYQSVRNASSHDRSGWSSDQWAVYGQLYSHQVGTVGSWVSAVAQTGGRMERLLAHGLGKTQEEVHDEHLVGRYKWGKDLGERKIQHKRLVTLTYRDESGNLKERKDTVAVAETIVKTQAKAEYYQQIFARNPASLIMVAGHVLPELLAFDGDGAKVWGSTAGMSKDVAQKREEIVCRWGGEDVFNKLSKVRGVILRAVSDDSPERLSLKKTAGGVEVETLTTPQQRLKYFLDELGLSMECMVDVVGDKGEKVRRLTMKDSDIRSRMFVSNDPEAIPVDQNATLRSLIFGDEGLVQVVAGFAEEITDPKDISYIGKEGSLFYALAKRHELMHGDKIPFDDMDMGKVLGPAGLVDETMFKRLLGDANSVDAGKTLSHIGDLAQQVFRSGDVKALGEAVQQIYSGRRGLSEEAAWESTARFINKMVMFGAESGVASRWWSSIEPLSGIITAWKGYEGSVSKLAFQHKGAESFDSGEVAAFVDDWCEALGLPQGIRQNIEVRYGAAIERQIGTKVAPTLIFYLFLLGLGLPTVAALRQELAGNKH